MISYLLNFTLCSGLLLLGYHLLLKGKTMFVFNRFYLLFCLVFSLSVPFAVIKYTLPVNTVHPVTHQIETSQDNNLQGGKNHQLASATIDDRAGHPEFNYWPYLLFGAYSIISLALLIRFVYNLMQLRISIKGKQQTHFNGTRLILIDEDQTPHTFLNYIFLNKQQYVYGSIDKDILKHEFTHARQYHSIDVIFIELIQVFCWFNPFVWAYKKAIQLNHEFIADAAVLETEKDVSNYQQLLLSNLGYTKSLGITSQFNYSVTKNRLIMMTKNTSALTAILSKFATVPLLFVAFVLFSAKTNAQHTPDKATQQVKTNVVAIDTLRKVVKSSVKFPSPVVKPADANKKTIRFAPPVARPDYPSTKEGVSPEMMKEYADISAKYLTSDGKSVLPRPHHLTDADYNKLLVIYKSMSKEQQKKQLIGFRYPFPPLPMVSPTQQQLDEWKNPKMYGLWIDGKHVANTELANYKPNEINQVFVSKLMKTAINYKNYKYQVDLMTTDYYNKYIKDEENHKYESIPYFAYAKGYDKIK